jgi:DNA-binding MarR family transcriptional regulator
MQGRALQQQGSPAPGIVSPDAIGLLVGAARRRIKQVVWRRLSGVRLTPQQFGVLLTLRDLPEGAPLCEVARRIYMDDPTACRVMRKLVERKLVRSTGDAGDRRRFRLQLTARGRELAERLAEAALELAAAIERGLSEGELASLRSGLRKVIANMDVMEAGLDAERKPAPAKARRAGKARP